MKFTIYSLQFTFKDQFTILREMSERGGRGEWIKEQFARCHLAFKLQVISHRL
jgi:hypothetical protein